YSSLPRSGESSLTVVQLTVSVSTPTCHVHGHGLIQQNPGSLSLPILTPSSRSVNHRNTCPRVSPQNDVSYATRVNPSSFWYEMCQSRPSSMLIVTLPVHSSPSPSGGSHTRSSAGWRMGATGVM